MALITLGSMVGQASGRLGSVIYSHNRGGSYVRNGTIPITSTTEQALAAKNRLASTSSYWKSLTDAQRLSWRSYAEANPVLNRLGQSITLQANAAYLALNSRLVAAGQSIISAPPITPAPGGLLTLVQECDIGLGDFDLTFTTAPLPANQALWIQAYQHASPALQNVNNQLRFCGISAAAEASPYDHQSLVEARLGTMVEDEYLTVFVSVFDTTTGLISTPLRATTQITST